METTKKRTSTIVIIVILVLVAGALFVRSLNKPEVIVTPPLTNDTTPNVPTPAYSGDTGNLVSVSVLPGQKVSGKLTVTGVLKGAYFFEATARGQVLDANKAQLKQFPIMATTDWMTADPVSFKGTVDLAGIAPGAGYIRLMNDNPSGEPANDKYIDIPVIFQ